ncbi:hypothetical protein NDU88_005156 [Pleurodeles waltl]|uniref:Uncharacterized protein n=1 Tax=Pleurodeles waltl TaxID=8319 RepID=A0AAV7PF46_PLEWA|nr:hypothetical protein NDU88_005156 [Pleurodeles waltl]
MHSENAKPEEPSTPPLRLWSHSNITPERFVNLTFFRCSSSFLVAVNRTGEAPGPRAICSALHRIVIALCDLSHFGAEGHWHVDCFFNG